MKGRNSSDIQDPTPKQIGPPTNLQTLKGLEYDGSTFFA